VGFLAELQDIKGFAGNNGRRLYARIGIAVLRLFGPSIITTTATAAPNRPFTTMTVSLETIDLPHLPSSLAVHVALYKDVQNASYLRQQLLSANAEFEYAFIDATMVGAIEPYFGRQSHTDPHRFCLERMQ
jgi:hypothetical protein